MYLYTPHQVSTHFFTHVCILSNAYRLSYVLEKHSNRSTLQSALQRVNDNRSGRLVPSLQFVSVPFGIAPFRRVLW